MKGPGERFRVLVCSPLYLPDRGGASTYFSNLVDDLDDRIEFIVYTCRVKGAPKRERHGSTSVLRIQPNLLNSHPLLRYIIVPPVTFFQILCLRLRHGPFIMHAHSNGLYGLMASLMSSFLRIPMIKEVQDTSDRGSVLRSGKVHRWIATGGYVKDRLVSFGIPPGKVKVFPSVNPRSLEKAIKRLPNASKDGAVRFAYVGGLVNRIKGVDVLIDAFRKASERIPNVKLLIFGDGPDRGSLEDRARGLDVRFFGQVPHERLIEELDRCDVVVLASHEEANPRCLIEGYALGLPAIATDVGGVKEELKDGRTGILVKDGDVDGLAEAMERMARDPELRRRLGEGGKKFLGSLPRWEDLVSEIHSMYLEMWKKA
ncbi:MAG: glycosyltransferase family 4 protein [Candidatus Thermoplasmatota archaeon]|nr:glycosyltransferase family 4 protein [Candidatus Thermoplasmatota archaeon]